MRFLNFIPNHPAEQGLWLPFPLFWSYDGISKNIDSFHKLGMKLTKVKRNTEGRQNMWNKFIVPRMKRMIVDGTLKFGSEVLTDERDIVELAPEWVTSG
jgi:hypothetical protein